MLRRLGAALAAVLCLACMSVSAQTEAWPTRPVRYIVPWGAGGVSDAMGRLLARKLSEKWGQPVIVENRPGGNTVIGAAETANAKPDGYTLLQATNGTLTMNPYGMATLPYDPQRSFTPISALVEIPVLIMANGTVPAKSLRELLDHARNNPDKVSFAYAGPGNQIVLSMLARELGLKVLLVPYKSGIDVTKALLSGEVNAGIDAPAQYPPLLKEGRVVGLAHTGKTRLPSIPNVPTMRELAVTKFELNQWNGLLAPAGLPTRLRDKIAADVREVMALPDVRQGLLDLGVPPTWTGPEEFAKLIVTEQAQMEPIMKSLGITLN
jgi:tripartite-type tricarboxylate transporter receptor subunit TctC